MLSCVDSLGEGDAIVDQLDGGGGGDVVVGVVRELVQRSSAAEAVGVPRWLQVVDPGIGFAKDINGNLSLLDGSVTLRKSCDRCLMNKFDAKVWNLPIH